MHMGQHAQRSVERGGLTCDHQAHHVLLFGQGLLHKRLLLLHEHKLLLLLHEHKLLLLLHEKPLLLVHELLA